MDEIDIISQFPNLQPCFPRTSAACDVCDGSELLYPQHYHSRGCNFSGGCLGRPLCPVTRWPTCPYCEDGRINFDYAFVRVTMLYEFDCLARHIVMGKNTARWSSRDLSKTFRHILETFYESYLKGNDPSNIFLKVHENLLIATTPAWTVEESFAIIDTALEEIGIPTHIIPSGKIMHVRKLYGNIEPARNSKYYDPSIGRKYLERYEARQVNAIHHREEE